MIRLNREPCNPPLASRGEPTPSERDAIFRQLIELFERICNAKRTIRKCNEAADMPLEPFADEIVTSLKALPPRH
jgi:hypothetical protein